MRSVNEVIKDINKYYGFDFATESFNKGRDTIYLDIPSVITTSITEEQLNRLCEEENIIETFKELFPVLKFFNSKDIIEKKEEFKSEVEYSNRLDSDYDCDDTLIRKENNSESDRIKMADAIEILNGLFKKRYVINSKRGIIFNTGGLHLYPFPEKIQKEIVNIKSKEDAERVVGMLLRIPSYYQIEEYLLDKNNSNWKKVLESDSKRIVVDYDEYEKFTPLLDKINKWLKRGLYFDSYGRIAYDAEILLSKNQRKKKKHKNRIETRMLPIKLTESFVNISSEEDTMAFLVRLYNFDSSNFNRMPTKISGEKIYVEEYGFIDAYGLLDVLRNINKRFNHSQVFVTDELRLSNKYVANDDIILQMIDIQKREDVSQEEKNELIFKKIESLNVINPKEYKFYGGQEMLDLENSILDKAQAMVSEYYDMLNKLTLTHIKLASTYSDSLSMVVFSEKVMDLKKDVKDGCVETVVERYKDIVEMNNPLFKVKFLKKDLKFNGDIYDKVIEINNSLCEAIKNIYMLSKSNVFNIISYYKGFIKEFVKSNSQDIVEALRNEGKYNDKDINSLEKELGNDIYFSKIQLSIESIYYCGNEYKIDFFDNDVLKQQFDDMVKKDIKDNHEKLLENKKSIWDKILEARKDADNLLNIKEYTIIAYLVGNEKNKGITTYVAILLGKKSEYSSNSLYGSLKYLKANKVESMIEELIDVNALDRVTKRASFGRYTAIVKGIYYNENIAAKFKNGKFIEKDTVVVENNKSKKSKDVIKKEEKDSSLTHGDNNCGKLVLNSVSSISTMEFIKSLKDVELTLINKNDIKVTELDTKDIQEFCSHICKDKRFYNKNWEYISNIIPPLSDQAMMFLKLKNINNGDSLKKIVEIEEKKREG